MLTTFSFLVTRTSRRELSPGLDVLDVKLDVKLDATLDAPRRILDAHTVTP